MAEFKEGQKAVDPSTGQRWEWRNGGWQDLPSQAGAPPPVTAPPAAQEAEGDESPTWGEVGQDIKKTTVPSLERGTVAFATTPGSMRDLAEKGTTWLGKKAGVLPEDYEPPTVMQDLQNVTKGDGFDWSKIPSAVRLGVNAMHPTYEQGLALLQAAHGNEPLYEAQTRPGQYYQTAVEMAPSVMAGPGTAMGKAVRGIGAALGSNFGREQFEGTPYEAVAQILGGVVGAGVPSAARRVRTPFPARDPNRLAQAQNLRQGGVDVRAGQETGSPILNRIEGSLIDSIGTPASKTQAGQESAVTRNLMRSTGSNADIGNDANIANQKRAIGTGFDTVSGRNDLMFDPDFLNDLRSTRTNHFRTTMAHSPELDQRIQQIAGTPSPRSTRMGLTGNQYQYLRSDISAQAKNLERSNPQLSSSLRGLVDALDNGMQRSLSGTPDAGAFERLRDQWSNVRAAEKSTQATGNIDPARFYAAHKVKTSPAATFARSAEALVQPPPTGAAAPKAAASLLGTVAGGALGHYAGLGGEGSVVSAILGADVGRRMIDMVTKNPATARLVFNPRMQNYLRNQRMLPGVGRGGQAALMARALGASPMLRGPSPDE